MKIERTKNASRNIIWGIINKVAVLLLPFITRTIIIKVLGAEYLGLNSLFTSILSVISLTELGFGTAIVFSMYEPIAKDDKSTLCALLNLYKKVYHIVGLIILVGGIVVAPFLTKFTNGSCPSDVNLYILYFIYLFNTVISYFLFAYKTALFSAYQRTDLSSKCSTFVSIISNLVQIIALLTIKSIYAFSIVIPLATILNNLITSSIADRHFKGIICKGKVTKEMSQSIKKRIIGLMSFKIYNVIFSSVDTIVISTYLGLTQLAIYNNYYYIQTAIIGFMTVFTASITAGIGNKMITNSKEDNYKDLKKFTFLNAWLSSWCAVCLICLYQHFMQWWVGIDLMFSVDTMILMVLYFLLPRISTMTYTYREAAGLWWEDRYRPLIATVVNLVTNIFLVQVIGINGVIISTLICTILINIPWGTHILFKNYFKLSPSEYFGKLIYYIVVTAIASIGTFIICSLLPSSGILYMIIKGGICVIIPNFIFLIFYYRLEEFKSSLILLKQIVMNYKNKLGLKRG